VKNKDSSDSSWPVPVPCQFRAKANLDAEGQIKFLVEEIDRILGVNIIAASSRLSYAFDGRGSIVILSYLISGNGRDDRAVLALEYDAEDTVSHAHERFLFHLVYCCGPQINLIESNGVRGIP